MEYSYIAVNKEGHKQKGRIEANDQKEVVEYLRSNGLAILKIKNLDDTSGVLGYFNRAKSSDIVLFTRQLSSMMQTGLTLIEALNVLKQEGGKPQMQRVIVGLISSLSEGKTFSEALQNYPDQFSKVYIALIRSAETGGILDKVLERLADNLEKAEDVRKKVKSALFYPAIVIIGVIAVIVLMNVFVIPQLGTLYESLDVDLPFTTRVVLGLSKLTTALMPFLLAIGIASFFAYNRYKTRKRVILLKDSALLRFPVLGSIKRLSILSEVTRTVGLLTSAGTSLISSLKIAAEVSGNIYYQRALANSSELVEKGIGLSTALENQNIFPPILIQMVKVGETTGKIDQSLYKVSEYFERDLDLKVKTLTTAIEPILIIILGIAVAFLILAVITPIYSLVSQIS